LDEIGKGEAESHVSGMSRNSQWVGRYCEHLVARILRREVKDESDVIWVNEENETGSPYDILLKVLNHHTLSSL
jgi:hypothetical protein